MSLRPQPVTSKFRRFYVNNFYDTVYSRRTRMDSESSGSTSSLTSILYHDSFNNLAASTASVEDISVESSIVNFSKLPEESQNQLLHDVANNYFRPREHNGVIREVIKSPYRRSRSLDRKLPDSRESERCCKRIIARKPDYPGSRITQVNHQNVNASTVDKRISKMSRKEDSVNKQVNSHTEKSVYEAYFDKSLNRKIAQKPKSEELSEQKSQNKYASDDFESESNGKDVIDNQTSNLSSSRNISSILSDDNCSIHENNKENAQKDKQNSRVLTAWEVWYLKKEKELIKNQKRDYKEMMKRKEISDKEEMKKKERQVTCQEKIKDWLTKKEEQRLKSLKAQMNCKQKKKDEEEGKKQDNIKKSSEKYVNWNLKKNQQKMEQAKAEREKRKKIEAEKMIQKAKSDNAYKRWLDEHKHHQPPVPYSYGVSDGKLTSYYDKTSNPPPSYFNPNPWINVIDTKN